MLYKSPLLNQVAAQMRRRHMAGRTEKAYVQWIRRFLYFRREQEGQWRHPREMASLEVNEFLTYLAVQRKVAASTQNQAFSALLFLFTKMLQIPLEIDAARAKQPERLPVVLSIEEVHQALPPGTIRGAGNLLYGAGLRLMEVFDSA